VRGLTHATIASMPPRLTRDFFARPTLQVAQELLGACLVHIEYGQRLAGWITEAEAYIGEADLGCHARAGRTSRTQVMFGPPGHAYVYFTYGIHWCLNFVTQAEGFPAAVLIRAIHSCEGIDVIAARRSPQPPARWSDGPGKLCQALGIDRRHNGLDLCSPESELFVETGLQIPPENVTVGPRVGLTNVPEPWKSMPWRFRVQGYFTAENAENAEKKRETKR
jgi:DNA-3-methyladenine glycosylase